MSSVFKFPSDHSHLMNWKEQEFKKFMLENLEIFSRRLNREQEGEELSEEEQSKLTLDIAKDLEDILKEKFDYWTKKEQVLIKSLTEKAVMSTLRLKKIGLIK